MCHLLTDKKGFPTPFVVIFFLGNLMLASFEVEDFLRTLVNVISSYRLPPFYVLVPKAGDTELFCLLARLPTFSPGFFLDGGLLILFREPERSRFSLGSKPY